MTTTTAGVPTWADIATYRTLTRELSALGADADVVADSIFATGARGVQGSSGTCPLAVWATELVGHEVVVGADRLWLMSGDFAFMVLTLPEPVAEFVFAFDQLAYPDLLTDSPLTTP